MEDAETCPSCKTSKYNKPSMRLLINVCAHVLCETCVEQLFFRGSGPCPRCGRILKKNEFRDQVFEDTYVEKEIAIRKKFIKEITRDESEFASLREFNDYLETIETVIFNLANNIDEEESMKKIEQLKKEAKESIKNRNRIMIDVKKDNPLFVYKPLTFYHHGPNLPTGEEISKSYIPNMCTHPSLLASGFPPYVPVLRLLRDSFSDLYQTVRDYPV